MIHILHNPHHQRKDLLLDFRDLNSKKSLVTNAGK